MTLPSDAAERHRAVAGEFTARVRGASDWDAPAPVADWRARDVVGHLVDWFPPFLTSATGLTLDLSARGMGVRSTRYSMLVRDGKVVTLNIESPGKFEVSNAETLLAQAKA